MDKKYINVKKNSFYNDNCSKKLKEKERKKGKEKKKNRGPDKNRTRDFSLHIAATETRLTTGFCKKLLFQ